MNATDLRRNIHGYRVAYHRRRDSAPFKVAPRRGVPVRLGGGRCCCSKRGADYRLLDAEKDWVFVLAGDGTVMEHSTGVCLGDMYISLLDEMKLRGFDATSAKFSIDRLPAA